MAGQSFCGGTATWCPLGLGAGLGVGEVSPGNGEQGGGVGGVNPKPGLTQRICTSVDGIQAARLMRSFINITFRAMMDLPRSPA